MQRSQIAEKEGKSRSDVLFADLTGLVLGLQFKAKPNVHLVQDSLTRQLPKPLKAQHPKGQKTRPRGRPHQSGPPVQVSLTQQLLRFKQTHIRSRPHRSGRPVQDFLTLLLPRFKQTRTRSRPHQSGRPVQVFLTLPLPLPRSQRSRTVGHLLQHGQPAQGSSLDLRSPAPQRFGPVLQTLNLLPPKVAHPSMTSK